MKKKTKTEDPAMVAKTWPVKAEVRAALLKVAQGQHIFNDEEIKVDGPLKDENISIASGGYWVRAWIFVGDEEVYDAQRNG